MKNKQNSQTLSPSGSTFLQRQQMSAKSDVKKEDQTDMMFYYSVQQSKFIFFKKDMHRHICNICLFFSVKILLI